MKKQISITTKNYDLYSFLNVDLPDGVRIISEPPLEQRDIGIDITLNIDISLVFDLTKISALAFAVWLCKRSRRIKGKHKININSEQIPVNDPKAIELIAKKIDNKKQD